MSDDLRAFRALEAEFAEKVLGWCAAVPSADDILLWEDDTGELRTAPDCYSLSLDAVWPGVEKQKREYVGFAKSPAGHWMCSLQTVVVECMSHGATPAEALMRALLKAKKDG